MPPRRVVRDEGAVAIQEHWRATVNGQLEALTSNLLEAAASTQAKWAFCPECERKVQVEYPDFRARTDAIAKLLELGFGKPQAEGGGGGATLVVRRVIVAPEGVGVAGVDAV